MTKGVAVEVDGVTRRFGSTVAVADVSFDAQPGEILGLLGPNGAGKTTTMRLITGYLRPHEGAVRIDGIDLAADEVGRKRLIGYVPEAAALRPEPTVEATLAFWCRLRGVPRRRRRAAIDRVVDRTGLATVVRRPVGTLSRGYRQRVALAQALVHDPVVVVLDEPTTGLDPRQAAETRRLITSLGRSRTVILSSHLLGEVTELCRRVAVLDEGRLVTVDAVDRLTADGTLEDAYLRLVRG